MPVFTFIGAYVASAIGFAGTFATIAGIGLSAAGVFVASAISVGLAAVTSKLINGNARDSSGSAGDQGVRVQFAPNSELKVPVVYGHAHQQGIITDAHISNSNKTMSYVLTLSEYTDSNWSVGDIYWNDQVLTFKADGFTVLKGTANDEDNTKLDGLVRIWVYAGSANSADQIHGPATPVNAWTIIPDQNPDTQPDSTYQMTDLVFAVVQIDYNQEKGTTGLPTMTFELFSDLDNPSDVWVDYLTNDRYGAGLAITEVNTSSALILANLSDTIPANQTETLDGVTTASTQVRYQVNGIINTSDTVKTNLDKINIASASWTSYNHQLGQWQVIANTTATSAQLSSAFIFSDDNIIGEISINATSLEDLYNSVEVGYADRNNRDQTSYYNTATNMALRNDLEPDNQLRIKTDLCNNELHAGRIGNIELRQSRVDLIISFNADYSALQVNAGDVIKVNSAVYGFEEDLFRVTRVREMETDDGMLMAEITALQYNADVYADNNLNDFKTQTISSIPLFASNTGLPAPDTPTAADSADGILITTAVGTNSYPVGRMDFYVATSSTGDYSFLQSVRPLTGSFTATESVSVTIPYISLVNGSYYFKAQASAGFLTSDYSSASSEYVLTLGSLSGGGTNADQVYVIPPVANTAYYLAMAEGIGDYTAIDATDKLTYSTTANILATPNITVNNVLTLGVSTTTPAFYTTGSIACANRTTWDPAGVGSGGNYVAFYNGTSWVKLG